MLINVEFVSVGMLLQFFALMRLSFLVAGGFRVAASHQGLPRSSHGKGPYQGETKVYADTWFSLCKW